MMPKNETTKVGPRLMGLDILDWVCIALTVATLVHLAGPLIHELRYGL